MQDMSIKEADQAKLLENSSKELVEMRNKIKTYRDTTQQKDDHSKFSKAISNVHQASNITELTMLALKISEEIKRA